MLFTLKQSNAAKILAVLPLPIVSHQNIFKPIIRELANRGHEVTVITMSPEENANYKQIIVKNALEEQTSKRHVVIHLFFKNSMDFKFIFIV